MGGGCRVHSPPILPTSLNRSLIVELRRSDLLPYPGAVEEGRCVFGKQACRMRGRRGRAKGRCAVNMGGQDLSVFELNRLSLSVRK